MAAAAEQSAEQFRGQARLPGFAAPRRYDLRLAPDLDGCAFAGSVDVSVDVTAPTRFLVLNAAELEVAPGGVQFKPHGAEQELLPAEVTNVPEDEILIIRFNEVLPVGEGTLVIAFKGTLNDKMHGFYRSVYELNGEKKNMAVTQFEPADARRCFPCWDEPSFKAIFKITLEVPSETVALSNMPVVEEKVNGPIKAVYFQETPIMSTYLVAVIVGMFDYVEAFTTDGTSVRVYTQVGKSAQGKFALEVAVKTLVLFKEYFAVPYPLPKMDMIAIPDFASGAMENYGLVTYRETALLFDEKHSAAANKQRVAVVVAHELAHQWFGNLVTMEWWTHLWLNEGFATWVSYLAADNFFPEWNVWTQFLEESTTGFKLDALAGSHPIEVDVNHVDEIDEIFDAISYRKGAAVIRMLQSYLGAETFQKSLAAYIEKFAYSNAKTEDLWAALEEGSGEPVKTLMHSWTKQQGYPVVNVKLKDGKLEMEQTQFLSSGAEGVGQWVVPITLCCCSYSRQEKFLFNGKQEDFNLSGLVECQKKDDFWIKLNVNQTGFYRVSYDEELASRLRYAIEANKLSAADRYGVLDDTYALCMAGKQKLVSLLHLIAAYKDETEYTVLAHVIDTSLSIVEMVAVAAPEGLGKLKKFLIDFLEPFAQRIGWDAKSGEGHLDALLRGTLLTALAELGHEATINEAVRRFNVFVEDRETPLLPPDVRKAAYVALMQTVNKSNRAGYESLLKIYKETDLSQEKVRILGSLASCPDPDVVRDTLDFMLSPEVRNQDSIFLLRGVGAAGHEVAWTWLKEKWDYISDTFSGTLLTYFVSTTVSPLRTDEMGDDAEEFFKSRTKANIARTVRQSIERVRINAKWVESTRAEANLGNVLKEISHDH
uniref:Aminopeptidase n=1 Tax=Oryza glumipatula TaxID=40148 RepID=A0A0D9YPC6_9ORYZ